MNEDHELDQRAPLQRAFTQAIALPDTTQSSLKRAVQAASPSSYPPSGRWAPPSVAALASVTVACSGRCKPPSSSSFCFAACGSKGEG